jgi:hypothetical protein
MIEDDEGDDGAVDGGRGRMMHKDDDDDEEIGDRDGPAEWADFMADYWRMLPPPSTPLVAARAATSRETYVRPCWVDPELDDKMLLADQQRRRAEPRPDGLHGHLHGPRRRLGHPRCANRA